MKTWNETKAELLEKLKGRLSGSKEDQLTFHTLQNHPAMQSLLDAFVGVYRERDVAMEYAKGPSKWVSACGIIEDGKAKIVSMQTFDPYLHVGIDIAAGQDLDEIGKQLGVNRAYDPFVHHPEPDENYRKRLHAAQRLLHPNVQLPEGFKREFVAQDAVDAGVIFLDKPDCECGAHALGFKEAGPGHSSWCPLARKS